MHLLAAANPTSLWPLAILAVGLVTIIVLITQLRVHAFLALVIAAVLTGVLTDKLPGETPAAGSTAKPRNHWVQAVELTAEGFGKTAEKIGFVIALAAVIGLCLVESGAADKVVRRFLGIFGEKNAGPALIVSGYLLSIPLFFETYFMLLIPLVRALRLRTGKDYMLYVMAVCCGGTVTHSLVAPHPGPLAMAENLHLDIGQTIVAGVLAGIIPAFCAWQYGRWISRRLDVPMREVPGVSQADLEVVMNQKEEELPSFFWSILPVLLPIVLIGTVSILTVLGGSAAHPTLFPCLEFIGHRNVALFLGTIVAVGVLVRQKGISLGRVNELIGPPLGTAGVIILITSAGGAFGYMLKNSGVGEVIADLARGHQVNMVLLAWTVSAVVRIAQGSATVAMITASAIMSSILAEGHPLPHHPIYIFLAVGFGSKMMSWMNDSGFWTVSKVSGFSEAETLKSWTMIVTVISLSGLLLTLLFSTLLPFK